MCVAGTVLTWSTLKAAHPDGQEKWDVSSTDYCTYKNPLLADPVTRNAKLYPQFHT